MISFDDAKRIAADYVASMERSTGIPLCVMDKHTIERPSGWVFCYDVDQARSAEIVAGNGPFIVDKISGAICQFGSGPPMDRHLREYERRFKNSDEAQR